MISKASPLFAGFIEKFKWGAVCSAAGKFLPHELLRKWWSPPLKALPHPDLVGDPPPWWHVQITRRATCQRWCPDTTSGPLSVNLGPCGPVCLPDGNMQPEETLYLKHALEISPWCLYPEGSFTNPPCRCLPLCLIKSWLQLEMMSSPPLNPCSICIHPLCTGL